MISAKLATPVFLKINVFLSMFLTALWLFHDKLWVILKGTVSLT